MRTLLAFVFGAVLFCMPGMAFSMLLPSEVAVVYNASGFWNDTANPPRNVSKLVADYYCDTRGIPRTNEIALTWDNPSDTVIPDEFLADVRSPLAQALQSLGSDPNNPSTDPIKAIVLCYGVPLRIIGGERVSSVDSALSLLFNTNDWGHEPIGSYGGGAPVANPYYRDPNKSLALMDFGEFRSSPFNNTDQDTPYFTIVRMLDSTHALAAGRLGILYKGAKSGGAWQWHAIVDANKQFIANDVNDICVVDSSHAFIGTNAGTVIRTDDGGETWPTVVRAGTLNYGLNASVYGVCCYSSQNGWAVGQLADQSYFLQHIGGSSSVTLPSNFKPKGVAAADGTCLWVSGYDASTGAGTAGIWRYDGSAWTHVYSSHSTGRIWITKTGSQYSGWAIGGDGTILQSSDGTTWTAVSGVSFSSGTNADLAVFDASRIAVAYGSGSFLKYDGNTWATDSSDTSSYKASVAWAGDDMVAACSSSSAIRIGQGSTWTEPCAPDTAEWKLRYLVCRLDGISSPVDTGTGIPLSIKGMIDHSVSSDTSAERDTMNGTTIVLDDGQGYHGTFSENFVTNLKAQIGDTGELGTLHVYHETDPAVYTVGLPDEKVIMYSSNGSYDNAADDCTTWYRPFFENMETRRDWHYIGCLA